ncbi:DNA-processing protein DprA [Hoyosella rhizosphaerae]|uniref:Smf/DprA SLOG domain-containing protein n=1 Tax=Hoyosella rhizosphaerae TaxID=1755582 RepID=A0A916U6E0_9ACTN|nr:DNA-processing protein DprA [Hoyosella rhizosphaerae]MBN4926250.1 DNA-processing protein DprA [Hoyosella rhizosphaerae]GGC60892.1 hypothetical protein GCM10011410_11710 [Hoyosella rhizosphaerae]
MPGTPEPRLRAWAYLSRVVEGPSWPLNELIRLIGPEEAARAIRAGDLPPALDRPTRARRDIDVSAEDLATVHKLGGRLVTPDDEDWPHFRFLACRHETARNDSECAPPVVLWALGDHRIADITGFAYAIVGTRAPSSYGEHITSEIAFELSQRGSTVISGAAYGVDGCAHRAAIGADGTTVAVLAGGIDCPYPSGHTRLIADIARSGMVLSEYPPGTRPARFRFLARNRLVAALSDAVVITEAGARSGARNTAKWARIYHKPVVAMPGPVTSAASVGCNQMIRTGEATLVTSASEIITTTGAGARTTCPSVQEQADSRCTDGLSAEQLRIFDALPLRGANSVTGISADVGVSEDAARRALTMLELHGHATQDERGWRRRRNSSSQAGLG